jgi:hypothetical protein
VIAKLAVSHNNTFELYNEKSVIMDKVPESTEEARKLTLDTEKYYIGVYREEHRPAYHEAVKTKVKAMNILQRRAFLKEP